MDNREALKKAAAIAKINLNQQESDKLVEEIEEILRVFSKIDNFKEIVDEEKTAVIRPLREDKAEKSNIDPFSNSKIVKNKKFIGPRLVE